MARGKRARLDVEVSRNEKDAWFDGCGGGSRARRARSGGSGVSAAGVGAGGAGHEVARREARGATAGGAALLADGDVPHAGGGAGGGGTDGAGGRGGRSELVADTRRARRRYPRRDACGGGGAAAGGAGRGVPATDQRGDWGAGERDDGAFAPRVRGVLRSDGRAKHPDADGDDSDRGGAE